MVERLIRKLLTFAVRDILGSCDGCRAALCTYLTFWFPFFVLIISNGTFYTCVSNVVTITSWRTVHWKLINNQLSKTYNSCTWIGIRINVSPWVRECIKIDYYSFKIFPRFWLAKSTRLIHHNQLLMTKFERILTLTRKWRQKCSVFAIHTLLIFIRLRAYYNYKHVLIIHSCQFV